MIEIEQAILAQLLFTPEKIIQIPMVTSDMFSLPLHKGIFTTILDYVKIGKEIPPIVLIDKYPDSKDYIMGLISNRTISGIKDYANLLVEKNKKNRIINLLNKTINNIDELDIATLQNELISLQMETEQKQYTLAQFMIDLENRIKTSGAIQGIKTGIANLDEAIDGLQKQDIYVVAGRSSMGKTGLMCSLCHNISEEMYVFSLEMTTQQIMQRILSIRSGVSFYKIKTGKLSPEEFRQIYNQKIENIHIDDTSGVNMNYITSKILEYKKRGVNLFFIDHIGKIICQHTQNRAYQIEEMMGTLKNLAKRLNVCIVCLVQINRAVEIRDNKRPTISDLRDSGGIEQEADVVLLLYRSEYYLERLRGKTAEEQSEIDLELEKSRGKAELTIAKNRNGECKTVDFSFNKNLMYFYGG